jgi:hypothetical protein
MVYNTVMDEGTVKPTSEHIIGSHTLTLVVNH